MMALVWLTSCAKVDEVGTGQSFEPPKQSIQLRTLSSIADRIYFSDFDEFQEYYLELDSILSIDADLFDSIVYNTSPVETVNDLLTNDSYSSSPYQTFMSDPVMRAIVNPDYEFQIGSVLVTYVNDSQILTSDASNSSLQTSLRSITKGSPLNINSIPSGAFWSNDENLEAALAILCGCVIEIKPTDCDELRVSGHCNNFFGGEGDGVVGITFDPDGLGLPSIISIEDVSGNFEFFVDASQYQAGMFSATANPDCLTGSDKSVEFYSDGTVIFSCDESDRTTGDINYTQNNERMVVRTSYNQNFLGYYHVAEMKSQHQVNGKWSASKADLNVRIEANRRSIVCDLIDSKSDQEDCNSCKRKVTRVSWLNPTAHCDGDCVGIYKKDISNISFNETLGVDFACCDE